MCDYRAHIWVYEGEVLWPCFHSPIRTARDESLPRTQGRAYLLPCKGEWIAHTPRELQVAGATHEA
jgi:hypothetical protein